MTLKELKAAIRSNLDDTSMTLYADDELRLYLNQAYRKVYNECIKNNLFFDVKDVDVTFSSSSQAGVFDDEVDIQRIVAVCDSDANPVPIYAEDHARVASVPCVFVRRSVASRTPGTSTIGLYWYRMPESSFTLTVTYCEPCDEFDVSDVETTELACIPREHHDIIVTWATIIATAKYHEDSTFWTSLYNSQLEDLLGTAGLGNPDAQDVADYNYGDT